MLTVACWVHLSVQAVSLCCSQFCWAVKDAGTRGAASTRICDVRSWIKGRRSCTQFCLYCVSYVALQILWNCLFFCDASQNSILPHVWGTQKCKRTNPKVLYTTNGCLQIAASCAIPSLKADVFHPVCTIEPLTPTSCTNLSAVTCVRGCTAGSSGSFSPSKTIFRYDNRTRGGRRRELASISKGRGEKKNRARCKRVVLQR